MARRKTLMTYLIAYLFTIGTAFRYLSLSRNEPSLWTVIVQWTIAGLFVAFFLLLVIEPWLTRRSRRYTHVYLAVQTVIISVLSLITPGIDYFSTLFLTLAVQAMYVFTLRTGSRWVGVFTVVMATLMLYGHPLSKGLPLVIIMSAAYFFVGSYAAVTREAEVAHEESQRLLAELQAAHEELKAYAAQAEELAVVQERNRLARNLHDSVTQTIFTMTLTAEAARILFDRDPAQAGPQLDKLQELAKSALAEMRSLVFELRPTAVVTQGLIPALRHHITMLERQHGLIVTLHITGEPHLPGEQAQRLFRIIQEALNNVVKHAQVDKANVTLRFDNGHVFLQVQDHGRGFAPAAIHADRKSMGLSSMRERAEMMGGTLTIDSGPGEGTRVTVEVISTLRQPFDPSTGSFVFAQDKAQDAANGGENND